MPRSRPCHTDDSHVPVNLTYGLLEPLSRVIVGEMARVERHDCLHGVAS